MTGNAKRAAVVSLILALGLCVPAALAAKGDPEKKITKFRVVGGDLAASGEEVTVPGVRELGQKLKGRWQKPVQKTLEQVEADFRAQYDELKKAPGTLGDPFRVIQTLPGVSSVVSLLPFPIVRGSSPSSTGFLLAEIAAVDHLLNKIGDHDCRKFFRMLLPTTVMMDSQ